MYRVLAGETASKTLGLDVQVQESLDCLQWEGNKLGPLLMFSAGVFAPALLSPSPPPQPHMYSCCAWPAAQAEAGLHLFTLGPPSPFRMRTPRQRCRALKSPVAISRS